MQPIKVLAPLATAALVWTAADALQFDPAEGTTVQKTFETETDIELDDLSLLVSGQDLGGVFSPRMNFSGSSEIVITDVYDSVDDGRPTKLTRTFDTLVADVVMSIEMMSDSTEEGAETSSPLDGQSVVFTWDDDEGDYAVEFAEGSSGDEELLAGLTEDVDMRALLPADEVSEGDSWSFDPAILESLIAPGGNLGWSPDELPDEDMAEFEDIMSEFGERMMGAAQELLDGDGTATYVGRREVDGQTLGVVTLEVEISSSADFAAVLQDLIETALEEAGDEVPPDVEVLVDAADVSLDLAGEGEFLWDLDANVVSGLTMSADVEVAADLIVSGSADGEEQEIEVSLVASGVTTTEMSTSR